MKFNKFIFIQKRLSKFVLLTLSLSITCLCNSQTNTNKLTKDYPIERNENGQILIKAEKLYNFTNNYAVIGIDAFNGFYLRKDGAVLKEYPISLMLNSNLYVNKYNFASIGNDLINIATGEKVLSGVSCKKGYYVGSSFGPNIDTLGYNILFKTFSVFDDKGVFLFKKVYKEMEYLGEDIFSYSKPTGYFSSLCGLMSSKGKRITSPLYYSIGNFSEGIAKISIYNEYNEQKWGYINKDGKVIIEPKFSQEPTDFHSNRAFVRSKDGYYSMIDKKGNHLTEDVYYEVNDFCNGKALLVMKSDQYPKQIIDTLGNLVVDFGKKYLDLKPSNDCLILAYTQNNYVTTVGYIDYDGNVIINIVFDELGEFNSGIAIAKLKDTNGKIKYGYINKSGEFEILVKEESKY